MKLSASINVQVVAIYALQPELFSGIVGTLRVGVQSTIVDLDVKSIFDVIFGLINNLIRFLIL